MRFDAALSPARRSASAWCAHGCRRRPRQARRARRRQPTALPDQEAAAASTGPSPASSAPTTTAQLQRGFQVYKEVCATCHSMDLRGLPQPRRARAARISPRREVKALAAELPDHRRAERRRRHVRASRPALRPLPGAVPNAAGGRGGQRRRGAAGPVADGQGARRRARAARGACSTSSRSIRRRAGLHPRPPDRLSRSRRPASTIPEGAYYNPYFHAGRVARRCRRRSSDGQVTYTDGSPRDGRPVCDATSPPS